MAEIRWFGHNCFRIKAKEATIFTDPVAKSTGFAMGKQSADIVTVSSDDQSQIDINTMRPGYQRIAGPGEYEMHDVFITGVRTYQDGEKGALRGYNTAYLFEVEGMKIGHLGNLGHELSEEQAEVLQGADIIFAPAGNGDVLAAEKMAALVTELSPKLVIPMRYQVGKGDKALDDAQGFLKVFGSEVSTAEEKLVVKPSDLAETMRIVVLHPES